jgi:hypothetical protein
MPLHVLNPGTQVVLQSNRVKVLKETGKREHKNIIIKEVVMLANVIRKGKLWKLENGYLVVH